MENWKQAALDFISTCSFRDDIEAGLYEVNTRIYNAIFSLC